MLGLLSPRFGLSALDLTVWHLVLPVTGCKYFDNKYTKSPSNHDRNNFIVGQVTPEMLDGITYGTYILFGLLTMIGAAFIWFFVPETKRLSLEEMVRTYFFLLQIPKLTP